MSKAWFTDIDLTKLVKKNSKHKKTHPPLFQHEISPAAAATSAAISLHNSSPTICTSELDVECIEPHTRRKTDTEDQHDHPPEKHRCSQLNLTNQVPSKSTVKHELFSPQNIERTQQAIAKLLKQQRALLNHIRELQDKLHSHHDKSALPEYRDDAIAAKLQHHLNDLEAELLQKRIEQLAIYRVLKKRERRKKECFNWSQSKQTAFCRSLPVDWAVLTSARDTSADDENSALELSGPDFQESEKSCGDFLCARSTSTYPEIPVCDFQSTLSPRGESKESPRKQRAGDPICDRFELHFCRSRGVLAVADGCNWGKRSCEAAREASSSFALFLKRKLHKISSSRMAARYLLRGFGVAHNAILGDRRDVYEAGTATMIGGVLMQLQHRTPSSPTSAPPSFNTTSNLRSVPPALDVNLSEDEEYAASLREYYSETPDTEESSMDEEEETEDDSSYGSGPYLLTTSRHHPQNNNNNINNNNNNSNNNNSNNNSNNNNNSSNNLNNKKRLCPVWLFVGASVGDCKVFHWSSSSQTVRDLTQGNRIDPLNPSDCGGRLGPHMDGGTPDLRNFRLTQQRLYEGDLLILMSDGVHDNLDPQHLGLSPDNVDSSLPKGSPWDAISPIIAAKVKSRFQTRFLRDRLRHLLRTSAQNGKGPVLSAQVVNRWLLEHCHSITKNSRAFMEKYPGRPLPADDYFNYPGKMDHSTVITLRLRCGRLGLLETVKPPQTTFVLPPTINSNPLLGNSSNTSATNNNTSPTPLQSVRSLPTLPTLAPLQHIAASGQLPEKTDPKKKETSSRSKPSGEGRKRLVSSTSTITASSFRLGLLTARSSTVNLSTNEGAPSPHLSAKDANQMHSDVPGSSRHVELPKLTRQSSDLRRSNANIIPKRFQKPPDSMDLHEDVLRVNRHHSHRL